MEQLVQKYLPYLGRVNQSSYENFYNQCNSSPKFYSLLDYVLEARKTSGLWHFIAAAAPELTRRHN